MKTLTDTQKRAIALRNSDILVSAAAGAGKTSTLIGRIVDLIVKDGVDINRMLIVTFTQAAASEMRQRLSRRIADALMDNPYKDREVTHRLRKQLTLLPAAQISTIHAFCSEILHSYFHVVGISPDFRIAEQNEVAILRAEALDESLDEFYRQDDADFIELAINLSDHRSDRTLRVAVDDVYEFTRSLPDPNQWLQDAACAFTLADRSYFELWQNVLLSRWKDDAETAVALYSDALEICDLQDGPDGRVPMFEKELAAAEKIRDASNKSWDDFITAIENTEPFARLSPAKKHYDKSLDARAKQLRDNAKKMITAILSSPLIVPANDLQASVLRQSAQMQSLARVVGRYDEIYQAKKLKKGILDFSDLEHLALQVLQEEQVAEVLRGAFEYIFVDEYQDTNLVQEAIIGKLQRSGRLFMVGDIKQSIYRFRNADPGIFLSKYKSFDATGLTGETRIDFMENHRSTQNIVSFVNCIFNAIMSNRLGEIDYDDSAQLFCGARSSEQSQPIEILLVPKNGADRQLEENDVQEIPTEKKSAAASEAEIIADRINAMVGKEFVPDSDSAVANTARFIRYSDIAILIRSPRSLVEQYVEVFIRKGIPLFVDGGGGYFETYETRILLSLLELLDNFRQDIPLISVLRSPICSFTDNELAIIRAALPKGSFCDAFLAYCDIADADADAVMLRDKVARFLADYARWRLDSSIYPLDEFIWNIMVQTRLYAIVGAMPEGDRRQANLRFMLEKARKTEQSGMRGVYDFVRLNRQIIERGDDFEPAKTLSENDNVVRLMSVHKSKGLEFPCVIVAGLGKMMNRRDQYKALVMHKTLGFGPYEYFQQGLAKKTTLPREAAIARMDDEFLSEEMRILYVALTRARDRLILVGTLRKELSDVVNDWCRPLMPGVLSRAASLLDWIGMVVLRHSDCAAVLDVPPGFTKKITTFDSAIRLTVCGNDVSAAGDVKSAEDKSMQENDEMTDQTCLPDEVTQREIKHILEWEYPYEAATRIPAKMSVSQIKKLNQEQTDDSVLNYELPPLVSSQIDQTVTGAEIGTAVHLLLSRVWEENYHTQQDLQSGLAHLIAQGRIRPEAAAKVNLRKVGDFLCSPIAQEAFDATKLYTERHFNLLMKAEDVGLTDCSSSERIMVQGIIDLYYVNSAGQAVLIDFKTDSVERAGGIENIVRRYREQLNIYRKAVEVIDGLHVSGAYLYLIDIGETIEVVCGEND